MSTSLLSLPNELLLAVIIHAPTTSAALQLLQVNQRIRAIWLDNSEAIIDALMRRRIVAYDDAHSLTFDLLVDAGFELKSPSTTINKLVENAELATSAVAKFHAWASKTRLLDVALYDITGFYKPYYFIRRLAQAHGRQSTLDKELIATLHEMRLSELKVLQDFSDFMCNDHMSYEEQRRQGMLKDETLNEEEVDLYGQGNIKEEWKYADDVITDRLLEVSSENSPPGNAII